MSAQLETMNHFVNGHTIRPPFPAGLKQAVFGMGCFWGAERLFWEQRGVYTTAVGYAGGTTADPDYRQVCNGRTGHAEVVLVVYDPAAISYQKLLQLFWESHDPTQGMRQGNDVGTQYRSVIFCSDAAQRAAAEASRSDYAEALQAARVCSLSTDARAAVMGYGRVELVSLLIALALCTAFAWCGWQYVAFADMMELRSVETGLPDWLVFSLVPVPGKPGFVFSPYDQYKGYIDVRGFPPGTEVKDPYSGKSFLVP